MDCFGAYFTHAQSCDDVRVQSAAEWTVLVHTLHMPKAVITFMFKVLRNGLLEAPLVLKLINRVWCKGSPRVTGHIAWPGRPRVRIAAFKSHTSICFSVIFGSMHTWYFNYFDCFSILSKLGIWLVLALDCALIWSWVKLCGGGFKVCHWLISSNWFAGLELQTYSVTSNAGLPRYLVFHQQLPDLLRAELLQPDRRQVGIRRRDISRGRSRSHSIWRSASQVPSPGMCQYFFGFNLLWMIFQFLSTTFLMQTLMSTHRSEGALPAMGMGEVEDLPHNNYQMLSTKIHGSLPRVDLGRSGNSLTNNKSIKKRSLRRAQRRLLLYGHTWYRGQLWMQEVLHTRPTVLTPSTVPTPQFQPPEHRPKHRLVVWHWNAGQLSPSRYQELLRYLHHQQVDVAVLSETHWHYTNEWSTPMWHAIHTSAESNHSYDKASGILVLVSKRVCHAHQISWHAVAPGRIIHCRLHLETKPFDLVGVYQYPWNTLLAQRTRRQTMTIWKHLRNVLQAIPQRNTLCILGDFNCSLLKFQGWWDLPRSAVEMVGGLDPNMVIWLILHAFFKIINL